MQHNNADMTISVCRRNIRKKDFMRLLTFTYMYRTTIYLEGRGASYPPPPQIHAEYLQAIDCLELHDFSPIQTYQPNKTLLGLPNDPQDYGACSYFDENTFLLIHTIHIKDRHHQHRSCNSRGNSRYPLPIVWAKRGKMNSVTYIYRLAAVLFLC